MKKAANSYVMKIQYSSVKLRGGEKKYKGKGSNCKRRLGEDM